MDYKKTVKDAIAKGIIVNTIFCGNYNEGISTSWKDGADLADGKYPNIDHNQKIAHIDTPFDDEILNLNTKLNSTYVSYGSLGLANEARQSAQDMNAMGMSKESMVNRAVSKSNAAYVNTGWDLVDAMDADEGMLDKLEDEELPEELKKVETGRKKEIYRG